MNEVAIEVEAPKLARLLDASHRPTAEQAAALVRRRYARERALKLAGLTGLTIAALALGLLLASIVPGFKAFVRHTIALDIEFDAAVIDPSGTRDPRAMATADYQELVNRALYRLFPEATGREARRDLRSLVSVGAGDRLREMVLSDPSIIGTTQRVAVIAASNIDQVLKGSIDRTVPEESRVVKDRTLALIDQLTAQGRIAREWNQSFFLTGDSRHPELAGLYGALIGSAYLMLVTFLFAVPMGIAAAVYLEEFAPKNRVTDVIEININNLAAVPSIVFGLLGLAIFLNTFGLPRSSPVAGGLTLGLMTLPTVVVATRAALRSIPPSIREAALGIGASRVQAVLHHVLPLAMPGILTGTIIGMAQALGETAPLLMIGMNAFIVDVPHSPWDAAAALPVQIYIWADSPERQFAELTAGAIIVLLGFLIVMNGLAIYLRRRLERTW